MKLSANTQLFSRITFLDKLLFTKHLSIMIKSGITIVEAIDILASETQSSAFKKVLTTISTNIKNGQSLSQALTHHPKVFDTFFISLISIGESTGTLDENLLYLADQLSKDYAFKKKVKGALMYPTIVLIGSFGVGMSISIFVLPKLIDLFANFNVKLPLTTKILLAFANIMKNYGILIGIGLVVGFFILQRVVRLPLIKPIWDTFKLRAPIFGKIVRNSELTTFCRSLGIMLKSGLPITQTLTIEKNISDNIIFRRYSNHLLDATNKGTALSTELNSGHYPLVPVIAVKMIAVGEKTGNLDETLLYLGNFFEDEVDDATKNLSTLLEPILLIFIGLIVAFIALAIISPIYQLTSSVHN